MVTGMKMRSVGGVNWNFYTSTEGNVDQKYIPVDLGYEGMSKQRLRLYTPKLQGAYNL